MHLQTTLQFLFQNLSISTEHWETKYEAMLLEHMCKNGVNETPHHYLHARRSSALHLDKDILHLLVNAAKT